MLNRLLVYAIIVNLALLGGFLYLDLLTLDMMVRNFTSGVLSTLKYGYLANTYSIGYNVFKVGIEFGYIPSPSPMMSYVWVDSGVTTVNLALIWFIVTIVVNLSLIWYIGIRRLNQLPKGSKTEIVSPSERKTS